MATSSIPTRRLQAIYDHTSPGNKIAKSKPLEELVTCLPTGEKITLFNSVTGDQIRVAGEVVLEYQLLPETVVLDITSIGTEFEGTTRHVPRYNVLKLSSTERLSTASFWSAFYAFFTIYKEQEQIPIIFYSIPNHIELSSYLLDSGLARLYPCKDKAPKVVGKDVYFVSRAAFWQGAGTEGYHGYSWLRDPRKPIPNVNAFTRSQKVIARHPMRPQKPISGQLLYKRFCGKMGKSFEISYFDLDGIMDSDLGSDSVKLEGESVSRHLAAFHKWHNDERVNAAWGEKGSIEKHRKYIEDAVADAHVLPCIVSWDKELMGYCEIMYTKEDHVAQHYPEGTVVGEWERNIHVLIGEDKFQGCSENFLRSLAHYIFLSDPRTLRVCGEPDWSNKAINKAAIVAGFHVEKNFDFPYKRSNLVLNPRDRFFSSPRLW